MAKWLNLVTLFVWTFTSVHEAQAAPTKEDLLPIVIPASTTASSGFARSLRAACETLAPATLGPVERAAAATLDVAKTIAWAHAKAADGAALKTLDEANRKAKAVSEVLQAAQAELGRAVVGEKPAAQTKVDAAKLAFEAATATKKGLEANEKAAREHAETSADAAASGVRGLRDACRAIDGKGELKGLAFASLVSFWQDPDGVAAAVQVIVLGDTAIKQSSADLASKISSGSLEALIIEGLAEFIYDRAKAEAVGYLAEKLKTMLCGPEQKPFFANLCIALDEADAGVSLHAVGSYLASAARRDLEKLPDTMLVYSLASVTGRGAAPPRCNLGKEAQCEALTGARLALAFYAETARGRRPLDTARGLHLFVGNATEIQKNHAPMTLQAIRLASELVDAILAQDGWDGLRAATAGAAELPYYAIGTLIMLKERHGWTVVDASANLVGRASAVVRAVARAHGRMDEVVKALEAARAPGIGGAFDANETDGPRTTKRDYAQAVTATLGAILDAIREIDGALDVLDHAAIAKLETLRKLTRLGEQLAAGQSPADIALELGDLLVQVLGNDAPSDQGAAIVRRALPIVSQLARAESADEVVRVLEAAAAPVGTYRQKSKKQMVTFNAFVGAGGGVEWLPGDAKSGPAFNLVAPLGLHASWPCAGNWGVFLSILNVGNLVSQRLDADLKTTNSSTGTEVVAEQSSSLSKVFSPGLFFTKSLGDSPFDFGLGVQFVPSAREVKTTSADGRSAETSERAALQGLVFLAIDVAILPF